jgi:hypothetical protein
VSLEGLGDGRGTEKKGLSSVEGDDDDTEVGLDQCRLM